MFANRVDIRHLDLHQPAQSQHYSSLYNGLRSTVALDYSIRGNYIIWSDVADEKIFIATLNKTEGKILITKYLLILFDKMYFITNVLWFLLAEN